MAKTVYTIETEGFIEDLEAFKMKITLSDDSGQEPIISNFSGLSAIQVAGMVQALSSGLDGMEDIDSIIAASKGAPGHTDLMISPEGIDTALKDNPEVA